MEFPFSESQKANAIAAERGGGRIRGLYRSREMLRVEMLIR
jgi:hypothetical protein